MIDLGDELAGYGDDDEPPPRPTPAQPIPTPTPGGGATVPLADLQAAGFRVDSAMVRAALDAARGASIIRHMIDDPTDDSPLFGAPPGPPPALMRPAAHLILAASPPWMTDLADKLVQPQFPHHTLQPLPYDQLGTRGYTADLVQFNEPRYLPPGIDPHEPYPHPDDDLDDEDDDA